MSCGCARRNPAVDFEPGAAGAMVIALASAAAGAALAHYTDAPWWAVLGAPLVVNIAVAPITSPIAAIGGFAIYKWLT